MKNKNEKLIANYEILEKISSKTRRFALLHKLYQESFITKYSQSIHKRIVTAVGKRRKARILVLSGFKSSPGFST